MPGYEAMLEVYADDELSYDLPVFPTIRQKVVISSKRIIS